MLDSALWAATVSDRVCRDASGVEVRRVLCEGQRLPVDISSRAFWEERMQRSGSASGTALTSSWRQLVREGKGRRREGERELRDRQREGHTHTHTASLPPSFFFFFFFFFFLCTPWCMLVSLCVCVCVCVCV